MPLVWARALGSGIGEILVLSTDSSPRGGGRWFNAHLRHALIVAVLIALLGAATAVGAETAPAGVINPAGDSVVEPIIFVPAGLSADPAYAPAVDSALLTIAAWFARELDGRTIHPLPVRTVAGRFPLGHYCPKTKDEFQCIQIPGQLGADPGDSSSVLEELAGDGYGIRPNVILLVFWVGGYGYAGGIQSSPGSGAAILADWALSGISGARFVENRCADAAFAPCAHDPSIGAIAHELGHALGLPHPVDDGRSENDPNWWLHSLMWAWWDFPNVTFIESPANPERTALARNPQLHAEADPTCPGPPAPEVIEPGSIAFGALCGAAPTTYRLTGTAGSSIRISAGAIPPSSAHLALTGACDSNTGPTTVAEGDGFLLARLPCAGEYALSVSSASGTAGAFGVRFESLTLQRWPPTVIEAAIAAGAAPAGSAFRSCPVTVGPRGATTFRFTIRPVAPAVLVQIWRRVGTGPWIPITSRRTNAKGVATYVASRVARARYRARFAGDATHSPGWSPACTVQ